MACCKDEDPEPCMEPTNPDCANYDPCYGKGLPSAAFLMEEQTRDERVQVIYIEEDSLFLGFFIRFRSTEDIPGLQHTWYVGSEILHTAEVQRNFEDVSRPATITIHHVIEYPVDSTCFPLDDGKDSVSQSFYLIEYWNELASIGTYRVANENSTDSFDFKVSMLLPDGSQAPFDPVSNSNRISVFENFNNNNDSVGYYCYLGTNSRGYLCGSGNGFIPRGVINVDVNTKTIDLEFQYRDTNYRQLGRKIN